LKTFLTQSGSALPLTLDPPVRLYDDQKGRTTIKIAIWGVFLPKTNCFSHLYLLYPPGLLPLSVEPAIESSPRQSHHAVPSHHVSPPHSHRQSTDSPPLSATPPPPNSASESSFEPVERAGALHRCEPYPYSSAREGCRSGERGGAGR
jgi:hypothetical protein